jgi:tetraacyldisaccharide 4'-kinase
VNLIERSWYKQGFVSYLFLPLTLVFWLLMITRKFLFAIGIKTQHKSKIPVIVVGNITVGGTGKTPFVIYLVNLLKSMGYKPGIVSRGYGAKEDDSAPFPRMLTPEMDVVLSGDEPKLLSLRADVPVVIDPKRANAVSFISEHTDCDIIISDDGLQHYAMGRDLEVVLVDQQRGLGNGWLLPVGPLRESKSRLKTVDMVVENSGFNHVGDKQDYSLTASSPYQIEKTELQLTNRKVHLISGIGNPQRFLETAKGLELDVASTTWLPDHHNFTLSDFTHFNDGDVVLMTEKDAVKCQPLAAQTNSKNWYVLPINACISDKIEQELKTKITNLMTRR